MEILVISIKHKEIFWKSSNWKDGSIDASDFAKKFVSHCVASLYLLKISFFYSYKTLKKKAKERKLVSSKVEDATLIFIRKIMSV